MKDFRRIITLSLFVMFLLLAFACSDAETQESDDFVTDSDQGDGADDADYTETGDDVVDESVETDETELLDEDSAEGEFLAEFDMEGKECITDIPDGRIMLVTARNYKLPDDPWRVYIFTLKDDGSVVNSEKFFEVDSELRGIGFNSNGKLAAVASWETGQITLFAIIDRTVCIADEKIELSNLKVNEDSKERVIFGEITEHPTDPYTFFLINGNTLAPSEYNNYSGGIYIMSVNPSGKAVIGDACVKMHVPKAFTHLPGGTEAIVLAGREFVLEEEGSTSGSQGADDVALFDTATGTVIKWFDFWGGTGENEPGPSAASIGTSETGTIIIANASEYSSESGVIKTFHFSGGDSVTHLSDFADDNLDVPSYVAINDEGTAAVVLNDFFKGATLTINEGALTYEKEENHDLAKPMIKLRSEPFKNHVVIHSFRSSNDESSSITISEITGSGLNEKSTTLTPLKDDYSINTLSVQD